jgi:hypothetical protein
MRRNAGVAVHHAAGSEGRRGSYYNASGAGAAASNSSAAARTAAATTTTKDPFLSATADEKVRVCVGAVRYRNLCAPLCRLGAGNAPPLLHTHDTDCHL